MEEGGGVSRRLRYLQAQKYEYFFQKPLSNVYRRRIIENVRRAEKENKRPFELLETNGWEFKRHGASHDIYGKDRERESVARPRETGEDLAKAIIRRRGLKNRCLGYSYKQVVGGTFP